MISDETRNQAEEAAHMSVSRRTLLARMTATGLGVATLGWAASAQASDVPQQPEADSGHDYPMSKPHARTEKEYRVGVSGPAMLSLATSKIAVDKATDPATKQFANFELREAIGITTVLKEMNTPVPPMDATSQAILDKLQAASAGAEFDKAYITAQLAAHEFLRDLAEVYLSNSAGQKSMMEMHGRHLAIVSLATFKEHVVHTKNILTAMAA